MDRGADGADYGLQAAGLRSAQVVQVLALPLLKVTVIVVRSLADKVNVEALLLSATDSEPVIGLSDPLTLSQVSGGEADEVIFRVPCVTLVLSIVALTFMDWLLLSSLLVSTAVVKVSALLSPLLFSETLKFVSVRLVSMVDKSLAALMSTLPIKSRLKFEDNV